jgi:hypothetical protein
MSVGYLLTPEANAAEARDIAAGFGLDTITATSLGSQQAAVAALQNSANVGIIVSAAATREAAFVALLLALSESLQTAQLILASADARAAFPFLPQNWPAMSLADAQARASELTRRRNAPLEPAEPPRAQPLPPAEPAPPPEAAPAPEADETEISRDVLAEDAPGGDQDASLGGAAPAPVREEDTTTYGGEQTRPEPPPAVAPAPAPQSAEPPRQPARTRAPAAASAPADATAFAPKKLRRGSPELIRIVIHQPADLKAVIKAARQVDARTEPAPSGMRIGEVPLGSSVGIALEVRGAVCDGALQRREWRGEPLDFNFSAEPDADVKQAVFLARVFVDDAQIGVLAFTRPVGGAAKKPHGIGDVRLKRHKRVFISYSSKDRETVAAIATAYQAAGVEHFFDRTSLKSGEEWSPRLRREIDRADLFHLCWSKAAAASDWVEKEAEHALTRRRRSNGKRPDITVQMLDGPPWAPHPPHLDSINFDDFIRAAIVGYARGDGES